jgi:hypothetical protein
LLILLVAPWRRYALASTENSRDFLQGEIGDLCPITSIRSERQRSYGKCLPLDRRETVASGSVTVPGVLLSGRAPLKLSYGVHVECMAPVPHPASA